ncbi:type II toxin-antitoxin system RelE/ParE family toxin [Acidithiobacillus ferrooxidans]|uniref:type II toxin-antitoxin system RelE/ParE family toxin n=1 Tax=Acidithiobacillus ferrooxidans TaxID=920 RepID=UPI001C079EC8|nr:type II toxin-antitoxin system RelE/ParE family toxin [Acidithiobacillus ferrooxidans]MBU2774465.1 type II toxin-antitoxin system RelE/ParE family toxin [Acidithiobacillus ferrooxidans]
MTWEVRQTRRFSRSYKKLHDKVVADVDAAVAAIAENPDIGEKKRGDLAQLWVYKFRSQNQLYLLGYIRDDDVRLVWLEAIGSHENFYRDLKH